MTQEKAKYLAEIFNAYAEGKPIEVFLDGEWCEITSNGFNFDVENDSYRIKKEPKYRQFKNAKECFEEMKKHYPIGWIYCDNIWDNILVHTTETGVGYVEFDSYIYSFIEAFNKGFAFADGQPFGIKEH